TLNKIVSPAPEWDSNLGPVCSKTAAAISSATKPFQGWYTIHFPLHPLPEDISEQKHKHQQRDLTVRADRVDVTVQLLRFYVPPFARKELGDEWFGNAQLAEEPEDAQQQ
uniref:Uncharacterized protein n=1 Tax=Anopheles culicifacies TaxID=139723 RepID=A0A182M5Y3_9DIPT